MKLSKCLMMSALTISVAGCANNKFTLDENIWCLTNTPKRFTSEQLISISASEATSATQHNKRGEGECGWRK